ncbi:MAG: proton-conducting transporter membrane subunit [Verrucomicrobiales bacterium]
MSDSAAIVLPVLAPLATAVLLISLARFPRLQRWGLVVGAALTFVASILLFARVHGAGPLDIAFGGWEIPLGIAFHADLLAAIMVLVTGLVGFCTAWYAMGEIGLVLWRRHYAFFFLLLLAGINGAFLTGDLFNLYVWFEVMLMASFAMMVLGRRKHTFEGATKYVSLNMLSSFLFLCGLGLLYGKAGSLNLADVASRVSGTGSDPLLLTSASLLLVAFSIKAGLFPLYFWLPASYPHTGFTTAAIFGGLLTKVGVYSLFRVFGSAFGFLSDFTAGLFIWGGVLTMIAGVLGAASQFHLRKILSFHIISQIGYLIFALGLFTHGAVAAAIFYTAHHIIVKTNLFLAAGLIARSGRSERLEMLGGLFRQQPLLAVLFAIPALSLGGIPPLSGFFAKFLIIQESFRCGAYWLGALALAVGVITLFSMTKIWAEAFWKDSPRQSGQVPVRGIQLFPVAVLAAATIAIGLGVGPLFAIAQEAATQLGFTEPTQLP